ncbi:MAG: hypothetical protein LBI69_03325 [Puniceicoccales bacterium]|nr:hypothetical protein [Puniceicoccales bacterium]
MTVIKDTEKNFREFFKTFFLAHAKTAAIVACVTTSVTTIAVGIIFQIPALIYGLCVATSIFCVAIAAYYWKFRKDKNINSPPNFETPIPMKAPPPEEKIGSQQESSSQHLSAKEAESIQPAQEQVSTALIKDLIKPSKFNLKDFNGHCYLNATF